MLTHLSHAVIYVLDLNEAVTFYTETLGLDIRMDQTMEGMRWVTVGARDQPDLELTLMEPKAGPFYDDETAQTLRQLVEKGAMGAGVWRTSDCLATYETFSARGVTFLSEPEERPYGIEAVFRDNSGNWFSLTQPFGSM